MMDSTLSFLPGDKAAELLLLGLYFCHLPLLCHALSHNVPTATGTAPEPPMSPTLVVVSFQLWPISLASQRCQLPSPWPAQHPRRLSATTTAGLGQLPATASRPAAGRASRSVCRGHLTFAWFFADRVPPTPSCYAVGRPLYSPHPQQRPDASSSL